jgi:transposase
VPNCKSFLVTEAERKHVSDARDFNNIKTRAHITLFYLQGKAPKEIHAILKETLGEHAPSYATVKNWVAQFKSGDFSICDAPRPGRPKAMTTPEIIDQIHELIFEDRRISAKLIAEQLGFSRERVYL